MTRTTSATEGGRRVPRFRGKGGGRTRSPGRRSRGCATSFVFEWLIGGNPSPVALETKAEFRAPASKRDPEGFMLPWLHVPNRVTGQTEHRGGGQRSPIRSRTRGDSRGCLRLPLNVAAPVTIRPEPLQRSSPTAVQSEHRSRSPTVFFHPERCPGFSSGRPTPHHRGPDNRVPHPPAETALSLPPPPARQPSGSAVRSSSARVAIS